MGEITQLLIPPLDDVVPVIGVWPILLRGLSKLLVLWPRVNWILVWPTRVLPPVKGFDEAWIMSHYIKHPFHAISMSPGDTAPLPLGQKMGRSTFSMNEFRDQT